MVGGRGGLIEQNLFCHRLESGNAKTKAGMCAFWEAMFLACRCLPSTMFSLNQGSRKEASSHSSRAMASSDQASSYDFIQTFILFQSPHFQILPHEGLGLQCTRFERPWLTPQQSSSKGCLLLQTRGQSAWTCFWKRSVPC